MSEMNEVKTPQVFSLIARAIGEVGAIGKESQAKNFSGKVMYNFRGIDAAYNAVNPVFAKLGLFIIPNIESQTREERARKNERGDEIGVLIYTVLTVRFTIYAPDGSSVSGTTIGEAMDTADKSANKAMSAALKYFLFQTLLIPTEDLRDPDADVYDGVGGRRLPSQRNEKDDQNPPHAPAAPASVEKTDKLPDAAGSEPPRQINPVFNYIENEKAYMMTRLGIKDPKIMKAKFAGWRDELVKSGAVENIPPVQLTMDQAKALCSAIYQTFLTEEALSGGAK